MTIEPREVCGIEIGIKRGLADIEAGHFVDFTPSCAKNLAVTFKARLETEQSYKSGI